MTPDWEQQRVFLVSDPSHTAEVRRFATQLAEAAGFDESETGKVAIVSTELATNLIKHAARSQILIRPLNTKRGRGIELLSLDQGSGIANLAECLRDGYSTAGTQGAGLGAIRRLSGEFDIQSLPGRGTAVFARFWSADSAATPLEQIAVGAVCTAMPGEERCGDGWAYEPLAGRAVFVVVDGLGHGPAAAVAAQRAIASVREHRAGAPATIVQRAHEALSATRGAALAVAVVDFEEQVVRYCGIGNISAAIVTGERLRRLVNHNGIAGHEARKIVEFSYPWTADCVLIMHSDGLATRWDLQDYPGLIQRHPSLIAGILYRDFLRGRDDVTALVAKQKQDKS